MHFFSPIHFFDRVVGQIARVPVEIRRHELELSEDANFHAGYVSGLRLIFWPHPQIARWACIPFSLLGAWMCYLWGRDLYNAAAGRLACLLWCFSPTILGQAQMITPDTGATAFGLAAA